MNYCRFGYVKSWFNCAAALLKKLLLPASEFSMVL
ncbi:MAG: hypothetical protein RL690_937, partial [Actinomycetota bacterium]